MIRTHVGKSADPIMLHAVEQEARPAAKPKGFWYEVDGDWRRWCEDEGGLDWGKGPLHELELGDERLLFLGSPRAIDEFTERFRAAVGPLDEYIDWRRVAEDCDGIEIAPYQWTRRLGLMWYYGWDCASGCIWRPNGATVVPISLGDNPPIAAEEIP